MSRKFNDLYRVAAPRLQLVDGGLGTIRQNRVLGVLTACDFVSQAEEVQGSVHAHFAASSLAVHHSQLWDRVSREDPPRPIFSALEHRGLQYGLTSTFEWRPDSGYLKTYIGFDAQPKESDQGYDQLKAVLALAFGEAIMGSLNLDQQQVPYAYGVADGPLKSPRYSPKILLSQHEAQLMPIIAPETPM